MHSMRFFTQNTNRNQHCDDQNIWPGTVIDATVVNNAFSEIFLNSHLAIQGTAKTPKYTIIFSTYDIKSSKKNYTLNLFLRDKLTKKYASDIPITLVIPSKMHSMRFFTHNINRNQRCDDQNICPGTVVDATVGNNAFSEFFLNSHLAIQGTAKTPKYTIIFSTEKEASLDMFERWTNALCYNFQIFTSPTSLPAPVYIANRHAERGR
uniref:Piwi domain-containing protein n=1 Tax=Panagrolaimus sp. ES5 TaxID=591445 RepID=A0AC34G465_9BILA